MKTTKLCKHGTFSYYTNDFWIGGALEAKGEYSEQEVQKLLSMIPDEGVVMEVGANIGTITVPMAQKASHLFAFEPQPKTYALLSENIVQNGLVEKVSVSAKALSNKEGSMFISDVDYENPKLNGGAASLTESGTVEVSLTTMDENFIELGRLDLLKIDVEGHELEVLEGGEQTIRRLKPIIYVENDRQEKSAALINKLFDLGYDLYWHFPALYNPDPMISNDSFVSVNMICVHRERIYPASHVAGLRRVISEHADWHMELGKQKAMDNAQVKRPAGPKRNEWACIVRLGGVGDNLICSSVLPALKRKYGKLEVICSEPQHVVFENNPHIDKLTVKAQGDPPWENGGEWQKYWLQRSNEYAFFANLSHTCEVLRALTKAQTPYYWPAKMRRKLCGQSYLETVADVCDVDYADLDPRFYPTDAEIEAALKTKAAVGGRYIGWVLTGSRIDKIWPPAAMVIGRIVKELGVPVVMFGAPGKDFEIAKVIQQYVIQANGSDKDVHLALSADPANPNWPVRRILTQTMFSDVVVSPDTGPAWAVAKEAMPKIILLSHASPDNITKHWNNTTTLHADPSRVPCWPCHLLIEEQADCERLSGLRNATGSACITDVAPDTVFESVRKALIMNTTPVLKAAE